MAIAYHPKFEYAAVDVAGDVYIVAADLLKVTAEKLRLARLPDRSPRSRARRSKAPSSGIRSWSAIRSASWPITSRSNRAPARSTPLPATARKTTRSASSTASRRTARWMPRAASSTPKARRDACPKRSDRQDGVGSQPDRDRDPEGARARCWATRKLAHSLPALLALPQRRSSSAPPSSGSSAWSGTTSASDALDAIKQVKWMPDVGRGAHLQHDRHAARLVHLAPARLGRADHRVLLRGLPRAGHRSQDSRPHRRRCSREHTRRHLVRAHRRRAAARRDTRAPSAAARSSARRTTFWTCGSIPDRATWRCSTSSFGLPWPADLYLEGGDQYRGWFHSSLLVGTGLQGRRAVSRAARSTAGCSMAKARRCTSRSATRSSRRA